MFGSIAAEEVLYEVAAGVPEVAAVTEGRIYRGLVEPDAPAPWLLFQRVAAADVDPIGQETWTESLRYEIKLVCRGRSANPILAAAAALHAALMDARGTATVNGQPMAVSFARVGELPYDAQPEELGGALVSYEHLGGVYAVDVTRLG